MAPVHNSAPLRVYTWWGELPAHLRTTTQLAALDLPRQPGGPVRAIIKARNPAGRKGEWDLYDVNESEPTAATGPQLAAAASRRSASRACTECGARPETPCQYIDGVEVCEACAHIRRLRDRQKTRAQEARNAADTAAALLADDLLVVLAVEYIPGEPTPSGLPRPPAAARIVALDRNGATLYSRTVRLTGPRTPGAPADAVNPAPTLDYLTNLLADRTVVLWSPSDLKALNDARSRLKIGTTSLLPTGRVNSACHAVAAWRGDLDPRTGHLRTPTPPGTADRLLYLLRRLAETAAG
ncbi:hypothetical protein [Streptomyces sp. NRRL WC-3742]|uniref:hypothetical protein n=1 Tax=Streptomyces sp. NRRL WC-3742 TaxID=1463934 RepID=UPI0004CA8806|nr:hypothetical protein [Streptomyces sp. NRRL WC-3742]